MSPMRYISVALLQLHRLWWSVDIEHISIFEAHSSVLERLNRRNYDHRLNSICSEESAATVMTMVALPQKTDLFRKTKVYDLLADI